MIAGVNSGEDEAHPVDHQALEQCWCAQRHTVEKAIELNTRKQKRFRIMPGVENFKRTRSTTGSPRH
jgi:hypothetical protein